MCTKHVCNAAQCSAQHESQHQHTPHAVARCCDFPRSPQAICMATAHIYSSRSLCIQHSSSALASSSMHASTKRNGIYIYSLYIEYIYISLSLLVASKQARIAYSNWHACVQVTQAACKQIATTLWPLMASNKAPALAEIKSKAPREHHHAPAGPTAFGRKIRIPWQTMRPYAFHFLRNPLAIGTVMNLPIYPKDPKSIVDTYKDPAFQCPSSHDSCSCKPKWHMANEKPLRENIFPHPSGEGC